jgi:glycine cleavage system H protein
VYPAELRYSSDHEWARISGDRAVVGITDYATDQLGDVVYVDIAKKVGDKIGQGDTFGVVESVKTASDLMVPLAGTIAAINPKLGDHPELVNQQPYGDGWMIELTLDDPAQAAGLLDAAAYDAQLPKG